MFPTGREWCTSYLQPLAAALDATAWGSVRYGAEVTGVARAGRDLLIDSGREGDPVVTGFRPDFSLLSEVRHDLDPALSAARVLAGQIHPDHHSCGDVAPHGHRELAQPEQGFFVVGMKSYGRAPSFLAMTGFEQVRSVVAALDGDLASADRVELVLPETGVCHGSGTFDDPSAVATSDGCCGAPSAREPELIKLGHGF
jgi:hypothetical protein